MPSPVRVPINQDVYVRSPVFVGADGEASDCASTPTCTATRDDGTTLTAPVVSDSPGLGQYKCKLLAATHGTRLDWLTLAWTGTVTGLGSVALTQTVEVVGGFYLEVGVNGASGTMRDLAGLADPVRYPAALLRQACSAFEDLAEDYTGKAWVPRYQRDNLVGTGCYDIKLSKDLPRSIISADAVDTGGVTTAFTTTNWRLSRTGIVTTDGDILTRSIYGEPNITIRYTHGADQPVEKLRRAAAQWVQVQLLRDQSQVARDVIRSIDPSGFQLQYSTADWAAGRPTGIDTVDNALNSLSQSAPSDVWVW